MKPTPVEEHFLKEAQRIVTYDEFGPVTAAQRLVQEWHHSALHTKDPKLRESLLKMIHSIEAQQSQAEQEAIEWFVTCKAKYEHLFTEARRYRRPPPDVCHPDHVTLIDGNLVISGPIGQVERELWEELKSLIKICAHLHEQARGVFKSDPCDANLSELKRLEVHRRRLMRQVPEGWNWREEIYCRYSRSKFVRDTITLLESVE